MYRVVSWERVRAAASPLEGSEEVVMGLGFWEGQDTEVQEREERGPVLTSHRCLST